jgi:hypothetical protein
VQKKQAFGMLPLKNGIKLAVQEGWGATPFGKNRPWTPQKLLFKSMYIALLIGSY